MEQSILVSMLLLLVAECHTRLLAQQEMGIVLHKQAGHTVTEFASVVSISCCKRKRLSCLARVVPEKCCDSCDGYKTEKRNL